MRFSAQAAKSATDSLACDDCIIQPLDSLEEAGVAEGAVGGAEQVHVIYAISRTEEKDVTGIALAPKGQLLDAQNPSAAFGDRIADAAAVGQTKQQGARRRSNPPERRYPAICRP